MVLSKVFSFKSWLIKLTFIDSDWIIKIFEFCSQIFVFVGSIVKSLTKFLVLSFALFTFSLNFDNFLFQLTFLVSKLFNLSVGSWNSDFLVLQLLKKSIVIFLSLMKHIFEFAVCWLKLSSFFFKLLESG